MTNNSEVVSYATTADTRGLIIPAGSAAGSGLQGKLSLVSFDINDLLPPDATATTLDRNIKGYKDLAENITINSLVLKLVRNVKVDANTNAKYITTIPTSNLRPSITEKNTAVFDVDFRGIVSGSYSVIAEYKVTSSRLKSTARLLTEAQSLSDEVASKTTLIESESEEVVGLSGETTPFTLDFQSNFGDRLLAFFGFLSILIMAWI